MSENDRLLPKLKGDVMGKVVTRFPPEASGYLHLGHIKALLINYLYAKQYEGKIILRFDDTNPDKEDSSCEQAILEDIASLGIVCDKITYASDYFDDIITHALQLISKGLAYVDFSTVDEISDDRIKFRASKYRDTEVDVNLNNYIKMLRGEINNCCLRAKIDYASKNGCMRDPVIFRSKKCSHPRHGDKYVIYPTYDFACPILDAIQGVTHAMRSLEYKDRDSQYEWFLNRLDLKNENYPLISDYGKLNFSHTILSKRKLTKLIDAGLVNGWADPRMPTIRGIIKKGIQIEPLISYIKTQATSRSTVLLAWDKLWSFNSAYLDKSGSRLFGLGSNIQKIIVTCDLPCPPTIVLANHPKDPTMGSRTMIMTSNLLVESDDFTKAKEGDRYTFIGLGNGVITCTNPLTFCYDKLDNDYKSTIKVTWLPDNNSNIIAKVKSFGPLLSKPKLEENDNILDVFNKDSIMEDQWLIEESVKNISIGSVFQVMRKGYCYVDQIETNGTIVLHTVSLL